MSNENIGKVEILYEDADCAVLNKPAGLMVHSDGYNNEPSLVEWIIKRFPEIADVGESMRDRFGKPINRSGIVHRLDKETSGAIIIAKTAVGHASLKKQFQSRTISKKYLAFVWGELKEDFGKINRPIGRSSSDFRKYSAQRGARGVLRQAETYWTKKSCGFWKNPEGIEENFSFVEIEPKTGRTHQIRVHFSAINHPVVGDKLYAPKRGEALGFKRLALHSSSIEFKTLEGKLMKVEAPLPDDFIEASESLHRK